MWVKVSGLSDDETRDNTRVSISIATIWGMYALNLFLSLSNFFIGRIEIHHDAILDRCPTRVARVNPAPFPPRQDDRSGT